MRTSDGFILGAITGAAIVWFWRREIEDYARDKTRGVRTQAADRLQAVAEGTGKVLDRGGDALRRAEALLQDTKEQVSDVLRTRAGRDSPNPVTREASLGVCKTALALEDERPVIVGLRRCGDVSREEGTSMLLLIVLSVLLLAVAIFALENAQAVTVRFLYWQTPVLRGRRHPRRHGDRRADRGTDRVGEPSAALEARPGRDGCTAPDAVALCASVVGRPLLRRGN